MLKTTGPCLFLRGLFLWTQYMTALRIDAADQPIKMTATPEGYLTGKARVARIGVQAYQDGTGGMRNEYRAPADVFDAESVASFRNVPVTYLHPEGGVVTSDNAKELSVGFVSESVTVDGEWLVMPITVTDAATIEKIKDGVVQLSAGYQTNVVSTQGDYNGLRYDAKQTEIRGNHVAIVPKARAGDIARLNLDAADAVAVINHQQSTIRNDMTDKTVTVKLDGIEYVAAPEVERHITKLDEALAEANKTIDAEKARADAAQDELKAVKETHNDEAIAAAVKARIELERNAVKIVGDSVELAGKTDRDVKEAVILAVHKDAKLDGQSDDYVTARFDTAVETHTRFDEASKEQKKAATKKDGEPVKKGDDLRTDAAEAMKNQWKGTK